MKLYIRSYPTVTERIFLIIHFFGPEFTCTVHLYVTDQQWFQENAKTS